MPDKKLSPEEIKKKAETIKSVYQKYLIELSRLQKKQIEIINKFIKELEKRKIEEIKKLLK